MTPTTGLGAPGRTAPPFGLDLDRCGPPVGALELARRRFRGQWAVDAFGADPVLQDAALPLVGRFVRPVVTGAHHLPDLGPAVLVANRGVAGAEPLVLAVALRTVCHRRLRVVGYADVPVAGDAARRFGAVRGRSEDLAATLRAGHMAGILLAPTWRTHAGSAPVGLFAAALGHPVLPVAVSWCVAGPRVRWHVDVAPRVEALGGPGDPLAVAEVAEASRLAVQRMLDGPDPAPVTTFAR